MKRSRARIYSLVITSVTVGAGMLVAGVDASGFDVTGTMKEVPDLDAAPGRASGKASAREPWGGPHHVVAMAYVDNLVTFSRLLEREPGDVRAVRPLVSSVAVTEMRRSFDQVRAHHHDDKEAMKYKMSGRVLQRVKDTSVEHGVIERGLAALEVEIQVNNPDATIMSRHARGIIAACRELQQAGGRPGNVDAERGTKDAR